MKHPYSNLRDSSFWYKAMTLPAPGHVDPVTNFGIISSTDKISTIGSCFAQHLSKKIASKGFNYFVPEQAPIELSQEESRKRNFGVFSARYGNVYTARQALQLFDRAYGSTRFSENIWVEKGRYIDGFRPQIEPNGFDSEKFLQSDRLTHFAAVRRVFEESDWIIFTLGLTEAWQSRKDGTIFPIAPGVAGGVFDEDKR